MSINLKIPHARRQRDVFWPPEVSNLVERGLPGIGVRNDNELRGRVEELLADNNNLKFLDVPALPCAADQPGQ